jgi:hypothetical protein
MFFLMFIPVTLILIWELRHLMEVRKQDRALLPICRIRGDLVRLLMSADATSTLTKQDYVYARWMLAAMDTAVGVYHRRASLVDLRNVLHVVRRHHPSARRSPLPFHPENPQLHAIEEHLNEAMRRGF